MRKPALTLLLLSLMCAPACFGEDARPAGTPEPQPTFSNTPVEATTARELPHKLQSGVAPSSPPAAESSTSNDWSPFLVIAAGIVGLVWVRRHVIDL